MLVKLNWKIENKFNSKTDTEKLEAEVILALCKVINNGNSRLLCSYQPQRSQHWWGSLHFALIRLITHFPSLVLLNQFSLQVSNLVISMFTALKHPSLFRVIQLNVHGKEVDTNIRTCVRIRIKLKQRSLFLAVNILFLEVNIFSFLMTLFPI